MDLSRIGALILLVACGTGNLTSALQAADKTIVIDRESHEMKRHENGQAKRQNFGTSGALVARVTGRNDLPERGTLG